MKKLIGMSILLVLGLTGCQNSAEMPASDPDQLLQNEVIHESLANTEYDSIEGFLADSDEGVFVLDSQAAGRSAAPSNAAGFNAADTGVSVAISYIAVTYECEVNEDTFKLELCTYRSNNGKQQLKEVMESNPDLFTEEEIGGKRIYYAPGSEYDWFDCYAMVIGEKLFIMDIENGYDEYVGVILENLVLQR